MLEREGRQAKGVMPHQGLSGRMVHGEHALSIRVYYEDTDSGGIVYHSQYLNFAERARTELLRYLGLEQSRIRSEFGLLFAVRDCRIEFHRPARFDDLLEVRTRFFDFKGASLRAQQEIWRQDECLVSLDSRIAAVKEDGRPGRIPSDLRQVMETEYGAPGEAGGF